MMNGLMSGLTGGLMAVALIGCSGDTLGAGSGPTDNPYTTLHFNARAIVMSTQAPYDTIQLVATPYDAEGHPIQSTGTVTYKVSDTTLRVSATGLLTAHSKSTANTMVIARLQDPASNTTHADTAYVLTTTTLPTAPLATFTIQRDSNKVDMPGLISTAKSLKIVATDSTAKAIAASALVAHFTSSDVTHAIIAGRTGAVTAVFPGVVAITASVTYYGRPMSDSLQLHIGYPDAMAMYIPYQNLSTGFTCTFNGFTNVVCPFLMTIGVGGTIVFEPATGAVSESPSIDVVFDDSTDVQASPIAVAAHAMTAAGNVAPFTVPYTTNAFGGLTLPTTVCNVAPYPCYAARSFSKAGTYKFHSAILGDSGMVVVVPNP